MADLKPVPSLIVGVGGTGVMVATYVTKDLYEITGATQLPPGVQVLAFDTEANLRVRVGGWGRPRQAGGHRTGAVQLDPGQYVYIGGSVEEKGREVAIGQHPYLGVWWNAREYLNDNLAADLWSLSTGAGMYRQFGRLALFENLTTVTNMLTSAIQDVKRGVPGTSQLYVHIAGSFVGGTGAGLFVDLAHVISLLAKQSQITQLSIRGYFALVDAFLGTPQVGLDDPRKKGTFQAQSYACLRESSRLITATDWATGYPMYYADTGDETFLRGKMIKRPFDAIYLFDGHRSHNELVDCRIEEGIAPTIADAIVAHVDKQSGSTFVAHTVNSDKQRISLRIPEDVATYGTLGTFTFVLPIFHIIEEWTHRLAKETMDELLVPTGWNSDTGVPGALASNKRGGMSAEVCPDGADKGREWLKKNAPTNLIRDLGELGERYSRSGAQREVETELRGRTTETWIKLLKPESMQAQAEEAIERATLALESDLTKEKIKIAGQTEDNEYHVNPNPGGGDREQAGQVADDVRRKFNQLVGDEDEDTGRRTGGRVKKTLDDLRATHVKNFRTQLRVTLERELNGSASADPLEGKGGKIGYLLAYLGQIRDDLQKAQSAIEKTEGGQAIAGTAQRRRGGSRRQDAENALKVADEKMRKGGGLMGANRKAYVVAAQNFLQVLKSEIAERVARETVEELIKVADNALEELNNWADALGHRSVREGGLYALVHEGRTSNKHDRDRSGTTKVRAQVADQEYEEEKYQGYVSRGGPLDARTQLKEVLKDLVWSARVNENTNRIEVGLKIGNKDFGAERRQNIGEANANAFLDRCRLVFDSAWDDMSVLRYLIKRYGTNISELADLIFKKSGPLLNVRGGPPLPANFLRVHYEAVAQTSATQDQEAQAQKGFLEQLVQQLAGLYKITVVRPGVEEGTQAKFADFTDSGDRFKLSFVYFSELNQLRDVTAYSKSVSDYRSFPEKQRTYLHIFPAEQHAVYYEAQLGKMNPRQRPREFEDRVVVQLEDMARFRFITRCLVYGNPNYEWLNGGVGMLLYKTTPRDIPNESNQMVYRLTVKPVGEMRQGRLIDPLSGKPAKAKHWDLTELARDPSLLTALNQFNYKKYAYGNETEVIDDDLVKETLDEAMEQDRARRVARGFPWRAPSGWKADRVQDAQKVIAQYLKYQEALEKWQKELQATYRDAIVPTEAPKELDPEFQREADLHTVRILVLTEEIRLLKEQVDQFEGEWIAEPTAPEPEPEPVTPLPARGATPVAPAADASTRKCPHCGEMHPTTWKACPATGEALPPPLPTEQECPHCGQMHPVTWKACPTTGGKLEPPKPKPITCPHCGETHPPEWKACPSTGKPLG